MANLLEQYGIKEVADVTIYDIETQKPVLFLDTLKVSTIEQTADQAEARGGKGNSPLIIWDYGKEITVSLDDALFTPSSLAVMFGEQGEVSTVTKMEKITVTSEITDVTADSSVKYFSSTDMSELTSGSLSVGATAYRESTLSVVDGTKIEVNAETFPGTYKLVGDTYARNKNTGKDEYFQFVINQAKMGAENTITLEAEGDPSVFSMKMRVLRPSNGPMMELIKYKLA